MNQIGRLFPAFVGIGIMMMMVVGCAIGPTRLEADYGKSVALARSGQILDATAAQNLAPVYGFDGKAAAATMERYQASFEKPAPPPSFVISVGQGR
ncbi:MAG TPA: hypothetical protein VNP04_29325 [Alphaproteobacteria bacterium]|nr:hypothetical protein [Alphaproteobacteria bacterium]